MNDFLKCLGSGACVYAAMAACGGGDLRSPVLDAEAQSGGRLTPYYMTGDDGSRQRVQELFYDNELGVACWVDDLGFCMPAAGGHAVAVDRYIDASCTTRFASGSGTGGAPLRISLLLPAEDVREIAVVGPEEFFELGEPLLADASTYRREGDACVATESVVNGGAFSLGAPIDVAPVQFHLERSD